MQFHVLCVAFKSSASLLVLAIMNPLRLPKNYKVKYFFSSRNPSDKGTLVYCLSDDTEASFSTKRLEDVEVAPANILMQGTTGKRPWEKDVELHGDVQPICLLLDHPCDDLIAVKAIAAEREQKRRRVTVESQQKFKDIWAAKLLWAKLHGEPDDPNASVRCIVCSVIKGQPKLIVLK